MQARHLPEITANPSLPGFDLDPAAPRQLVRHCDGAGMDASHEANRDFGSEKEALAKVKFRGSSPKMF